LWERGLKSESCGSVVKIAPFLPTQFSAGDYEQLDTRMP